MDHTITSIKVQKRNPNRLAIYLDGEFAFGLARIVAAWLTIGQVISDEKIAELQEKDYQEGAYQYAILVLSYRPRSIAELRQKMTAKGYSEAVIDMVIERLTQSGLLNDTTFAQAWVENRSAFHPRSRRALTIELHRKGVTDEVIAQTLGETGNEEEMAYQAAQPKARKLAGLERIEFRNKLGAFLGRRGFSFDTISPVINRLWNEIHTDEDGNE
jgi:regulatory protein